MITYHLVCPECRHRRRVHCSSDDRYEIACGHCGHAPLDTDWQKQGANAFRIEGWSPDNEARR